MLAGGLEDRSLISCQQQPEIIEYWQNASRRQLKLPREKAEVFCVSPFDVLVEETPGGNLFHIIELNGTGIGGLTNLPVAIVEEICNSIAEIAYHVGENPLIIVAISGKEDDSQPRRNKLLHEKLLYVDRIEKKLCEIYGEARICTVENYAARADELVPTVLLGYMKDLLDHLEVDEAGGLHFCHGSLPPRLVGGVVNDRFFLNICQKFNFRVDTSPIVVRNGTYLAGADKATAYQLWNNFLRQSPHPSLPDSVDFAIATTLYELEEIILRRNAAGLSSVIKPSGTGLGHGIEFFFPEEEEEEAAIRFRIRSSVREVAEYYGVPLGAFPYTVSKFIPTKVIQSPGEWLRHKFEIRVVVYRHGAEIRAVPSIAKVSSRAFDPLENDRMSLINNITASTTSTHREGTDFILPMASPSTLEVLGVTIEEMRSLSVHCTAFMEYVLGLQSFSIEAPTPPLHVAPAEPMLASYF